MWQRIEQAVLVAGVAALGVFAYAYAEPRLQAAQAVSRFAQTEFTLDQSPDMALWSPERIEAYRSADTTGTAIGVLSIDSVAIKAPIYVGTSDAILDRGVGWIEGTSPLGGPSNVGLAAHRDGFFRGLKDLEIGAIVSLRTAAGEQTFRVTGTDIVAPEETYVLEPTMKSTLTLVTCYPFYFVGSAPERFVVFATAIEKAKI